MGLVLIDYGCHSNGYWYDLGQYPVIDCGSFTSECTNLAHIASTLTGPALPVASPIKGWISCKLFTANHEGAPTQEHTATSARYALEQEATNQLPKTYSQ